MKICEILYSILKVVQAIMNIVRDSKKRTCNQPLSPRMILTGVSPAGKNQRNLVCKRPSTDTFTRRYTRSKSINRVPSLEDLYKIMPERNPETLREKKVMYHIGIDWASDHHDVAVVDSDGNKISAFRIDQKPEGLEALREKLHELSAAAGGKEKLVIGIETARLLLVEFLLNEGYSIYPINPKAVDRYRDRYTSSKAKDDNFDAEVIANALRTDLHRLRLLRPDSELLRELRILVKDQSRLIRIQTMFFNQLHACLKDYYPVAEELFDNLDGVTPLEYLKRYPRPTNASFKELEKFLRSHHHPHPEKKAREIADALSGPQIPVDEFTVRAKSFGMLAKVENIQMLRIQIQNYQDKIDELFEKHPDSNIFKSLPGAGEKTAPRLLVEFGDNRERYSDADSVQCEAGTSPVTRKSGNAVTNVCIRRACRKTFRNTMHQFSYCSLKQNSWAKVTYDQQRAKKATHASALRVVGDKWIKIIYQLWKKGIPYDENIFLASRMRHQLQETRTTLSFQKA